MLSLTFSLFYLFCSAQKSPTSLNFHLKTSVPSSQSIVDSIYAPKAFSNFVSIEKVYDSLQTILLKKGYWDLEAYPLEAIKDTVNGRIQLNTRYTTAVLKSKTLLHTPKQKSRISNRNTLQKPTRITVPIYKLENYLTDLNYRSVQEGNTFNSVYLEHIRKSNDTVYAEIHSTASDTLRYIDSLVVSGYTKFSKTYIRHYTGLRRKQRFTQEKVVAAAQKLTLLPFLNSLKPPEALFTASRTIVYLPLSRAKANFFDGIIGFTTDEDSQKLVFNGYFNLDLQNNLHLGERLNLSYKSDGNEQQRFHLETEIPYIAKTPLGIKGYLDIFQKDSTFVTTEQSIESTYTVLGQHQFALGYKGFESSNLLDTEALAINTPSYSANFVHTGYTFRKLQAQSLFPEKIKIGLNYDWGRRETETNSQPQQKLYADISYIWNLNPRNSIYLANQSAFLQSDTYVTNELFRFGGVNSIRGFEENSLFADVYSALSTEYRFILSPSVFIHSILDYGYIENQISDLSATLTGVGIGLGLQRNSGLFRILFANGVSEGQSFSFSNTRVHVKLISRF